MGLSSGTLVGTPGKRDSHLQPALLRREDVSLELLVIFWPQRQKRLPENGANAEQSSFESRGRVERFYGAMSLTLFDLWMEPNMKQDLPLDFSPTLVSKFILDLCLFKLNVLHL